MEWMPFGQKSLDFIKRPISQDARINILEGSVRSSKTFTMIPKWLRYIKEGPKGLLLMTAVSKDTLYDNVLRDLFDTVGNANYNYNRQNGELTLCGRDIKCLGAKDEGSEKYLRGKTLAGAYSDEATLLPERFLKQLLNRLSVPGAKYYQTTNPDTPAHYLYREFITNEQLLSSGGVDVIHFELDDNPNLDEEYKAFIRSAYTGLFYKRMILGLWVMGDGSIYDMWTDENVYDENPLPPGIMEVAIRDIAIDYGTTNPMVFLDVYDTGDKILIDREYYYDSTKAGRQKTDAQYADDLDVFTGGPEFVRYIILDPSAASFRAELRMRGYRVKEADNEVNDGIRLTSTLIHRKILMVNKRCENFVREICSYIWDSKAAERGEEKPVKKDDHSCLSSDTVVVTDKGEKKIKYIQPGDEVLTPFGYSKVESSGITGFKELYLVKLSNGSSLKVTLDHPVFAHGKGFTPMSIGDKISYGIRKGILWNLFSLMGKNIIGMVDIMLPLAAALMVVKDCMLLYGSIIMALCQKVGMSTIKTIIEKTTHSPTLNACLAINICPSMVKTSLKNRETISDEGLIRLDILQSIGINQTRVGSGTLIMQKESLQQLNLRILNVLFVQNLSNLKKQMRNFARIIVSLQIDGHQRLMKFLPSALFAESSTQGINTKKVKPVPLSVVGVSSLGMHPVYNLSLEKYHCFYANGIVVSNCDATRYWIKTMFKENRLLKYVQPAR